MYNVIIYLEDTVLNFIACIMYVCMYYYVYMYIVLIWRLCVATCMQFFYIQGHPGVRALSPKRR